jgi:hypothetical protein
MKRFLLFIGDTYYPRGGARDYAGNFDTRTETLHHISDILKKEITKDASYCEWAQIWDTTTSEIYDLHLKDKD